MSILVQSIIDSCNALLDAEDSDRYLFDTDFKPAINYAQKWLISLYNKIFGLNQVSEESLKELTVVRCFKLSNYSRLSFSSQGIGVTDLLDAAAAVTVFAGTMTKIPCTDHIFNVNDWIVIFGTTNYDGTWQILDITDDTFTIGATYATEVFGGTETAFKGDKLWRVLAIYPEITTIPTAPAGLPADADQSSYLDDVAMATPLKSATRLTLEQWAEKEENPLMPGSPLITNTELIQYAYLNFIDYNANAYLLEDVDYEIPVSPDRANEIAAMAFLKVPMDITDEREYIPFPVSLFEIVVQKAMHFISIKEDDRENLFTVTQNEIQQAMEVLT